MLHAFRIVSAVTALGMLSGAASAQSADAPLQLEAKIPLGEVRGRIDHLAVDLKRQRLFVAELGNNSLGIVDLTHRSLLNRIGGLNEPQGVGYEPSTDTLYVANARTGLVNLFEGDAYTRRGNIELGGDADNVRLDAAGDRIIIGYGDGGLAVIDPSAQRKVKDIVLQAHPESFQIDPNTGRIFVNLPEAHVLAVIDGKSGASLANWSMEKGGNFAMTIDRDRSALLVAFRSPPELTGFDLSSGKVIASRETCGDVDDLFVDAKRSRLYVSCGAGFVDVLELNGGAYRSLARIPTAKGARTSLFVPEMDRLFVAVRARFAGAPEIWMFKPVP